MENLNLDMNAVNNFEAYNQSSPKGSVHTSNNVDAQSDQKSIYFDSSNQQHYFNGQPDQTNLTQMNNGKNKIRVVVRMRPYLDGEEQEIQAMSDVQATGQVRIIEDRDEIE